MRHLFSIRKKNILFALSIPLIITLILSTSCNRQQPPIEIGLAINLSGRGGAAGEHIRDGALLAVREINEADGINGRPLKLLIRDDRNTKEGVKEAARSLLQEEVVAIIGHSTSANALISYPIVTAANTLLVSPYVATNKLTGKDDLFLRTTPSSDLYGKKAAKLLNDRSISSISILIDMSNYSFTGDWASSLQKYFNGSSYEIRFNHPKADKSWSSIINGLLAPEPGAIVLLSEAGMTGIALQKLGTAGYTGLRIASTWAQAPELFRSAEGAVEGLIIPTFLDEDNPSPGFLHFSDKMKKYFGTKGNLRSGRAYEIMIILADALARCEDINSHEQKQALLTGEYETILGEVSFDRYGDVVRPIYEMVVRDGKFHNNGEI